MLNLRIPTVSHKAFPLSNLAPTSLISEYGEQMKALLRHPRSRIRITPGWRAPYISAELNSADALVHVSRHRVTPVLWEKLNGVEAPSEQPMFLVTLSATVDADSVSGSLASVTSEIHSLFRAVTGESWTQREHVGDNLTWTWHSLMTQRDLDAATKHAQPHVA